MDSLPVPADPLSQGAPDALASGAAFALLVLLLLIFSLFTLLATARRYLALQPATDRGFTSSNQSLISPDKLQIFLLLVLSSLVVWLVQQSGWPIPVAAPLLVFVAILVAQGLANRWARLNGKLAHFSFALFRFLHFFPAAGNSQSLSTEHSFVAGTGANRSEATLPTSEESPVSDERTLLQGVTNFGGITARQAMQPRTDVAALSLSLNFHQLLNQINKLAYSRIPVYGDSLDDIRGILYIKDVLPHINKDEHFAWPELLRPVYFIPEVKLLDELLREFQQRRVHLALVIDEFGATTGLITLEDIIEEIVGEIQDEFDEETPAFTKLDEATYLFEGKISLNDFAKIINVDAAFFEIIKGDSESLGGLLLELFARLPHVGEKTVFDRFEFTVAAVDSKKIKRVKVSLLTPASSVH